MKIKQLTEIIEKKIPPVYAEHWDNVGLLVGDPEREIESVLIALDCSEAVIDEAIAKKSGLIITHHPLIFGSLKKVVTTDFTARLIMKAIKNDIAIYAVHTNLDNIYNGINFMIANELDIIQTSILAPQHHKLFKIVTFVPVSHFEIVRAALFNAQMGYIGNYDSCSFATEGIGSFRAKENAHPFVGECGKLHFEQEMRLEVVVAEHQRYKAIEIIKKSHPYEEPAIDIFALENSFEKAGSGLVGILKQPIDEMDFLKLVKNKMQIPALKHSKLTGKKIKKVALCSGAGAFLMSDAIRCNADAFVTSDVKYHEFFVPENKLLLIDAGHYETEQFSRHYLYRILKENFTTFAVQISETAVNAVNYLI